MQQIILTQKLFLRLVKTLTTWTWKRSCWGASTLTVLRSRLRSSSERLFPASRGWTSSRRRSQELARRRRSPSRSWRRSTLGWGSARPWSWPPLGSLPSRSKRWKVKCILSSLLFQLQQALFIATGVELTSTLFRWLWALETTWELNAMPALEEL